MGSGMGYMGKLMFSAAALLCVSLFGMSSVSEAKPKLQTKLPAQVKKIKIVKAKLKQVVKHKLAAAPALMADLDKTGLSPFDNKYVTKTVHFAASTGELGAEFDCDGSTKEQQIRKAERDALEKCEANGEKHCRVHQSKIVKQGDLRCQDIPGRDCGQRKFYRGCVAQAIAVGGEEAEGKAIASGINADGAGSVF
jgi:hypothetical protein